MKLILFDFDKTLTYTDTLLPLASYLCKALNKKSSYFKISFNYLLFRLSFIDELNFKRIICKLLVEGKRVDEIDILIRKFYNNNSVLLLNKIVTEILESENSKGNHCYIISSNFNFLLNPLKGILPIKGIESTTAEIVNGIYTGLIAGKNCSKSEKWERVQQIKTKFDYDEIIAYGDSAGDYDMLKNSDKAFWVRLKIKDPIGTGKSKKIKAIFYYLIGKVYKPDCETEIIKFIH